MPVTLDWQQITIRLALTVLAGLVIGFNRGEHGRPAGLRTTLLVCLAASIAMIQANLLMNMVGRKSDSFIMLDLMRLPLGILSGMGFIGAGAILRKDNLVLGVTTAATLWFTTVVGLCFGGGQLGLGIAATVLGFLTLWGLKHVERAIPQDARGKLTLEIGGELPTDEQIRKAIARGGVRVISWSTEYANRGASRRVCGELERRTMPDESRPPPFVAEFAKDANIRFVKWQPQGIPEESNSSNSQNSGPFGTPIPISPQQ
jgi:putative Mg2+ transporter-C (MgtC) family protein